MATQNLTFHPMISGCEAADPAAWGVFLSRFTPIIFRLLGVYAPNLGAEDRKSVWKDSLGLLVADDFARLRQFDHQAEREFMMDLKWFVLEQTAKKLAHPASQVESAVEKIQSRLSGLPVAHQEILLMALSGYPPEGVGTTLVAPASLVSAALENGPDGAEGNLALEDWPQILTAIRAAQTPECPPYRTWVRILDGQASWYDKTPAENHMMKCLHCLETWVSLREADCLRRTVAPLAEDEAAEYFSALPFAPIPAGKSWAARLFGR